MKILARPIEVLAHYPLNGVPRPMRFRIENKQQEMMTVKINRVQECREELLAGNKMYVYVCASIINGEEGLMELKYEVASCLWYLFKI